MAAQEHIFFESGGNKLFAAFFLPKEGVPVSEGYIICPPFAEEKKSSQTILVNLARVICKNNIPVLMFDYYGCGDSEGDFKDSNLSLWIENTVDAVNMLKNLTRLRKVIMIGLRLGGFIASKVSEKIDFIEEVILIEPVLTPNQYFRHTIRQKQIREIKTFGDIKSTKVDLIEKLDRIKKIDLDGYEISQDFYLDLIKYESIKTFHSDSKFCILHVTRKNKTSEEYKKLPNNIDIKKIKMLPFWNRIEKCEASNLVKEVELKFRDAQ